MYKQTPDEFEVMAVLARQFVHDIRSPLSALNILATLIDTNLSAETKSLLRATIQRLQDLSNELATSSSKAQPQCLLNMLHQLLNEQRLLQDAETQVRLSLELSSLGGELWYFQSLGIPRMLSNLIGNSVEAIGRRRGHVIVTAKPEGENLSLQVQDDGHGLKPELLAQVGRRGFTSGKPQGSGLGLWHAFSLMKSLGGELQIRSQERLGTTVTMRFPIKKEGIKFLIG